MITREHGLGAIARERDMGWDANWLQAERQLYYNPTVVLPLPLALPLALTALACPPCAPSCRGGVACSMAPQSAHRPAALRLELG